MRDRNLSAVELHNLLLPMRRWWCAHADRTGIERSHWVRYQDDATGELYTLCWHLTPSCDLVEIEGNVGQVLWSRRALIRTAELVFLSEDQRVQMMSFLKRKVEEVKAATKTTMATCPIMSNRPALVEWLTADKWEDDGKPRETSTLTVSVVDGMWKVSLNDRDGQRSTFVTASTLGQALQALENRVAEDECDWRDWSDKYRGKGKKK